MLQKIVLFTIFTLSYLPLRAQSVPDTLQHHAWSARWLAHPTASLTDYHQAGHRTQQLQGETMPLKEGKQTVRF